MPIAEPNHRGPVGVIGLWHLGCVTAACLAQSGLQVVGVDPDAEVVEQLAKGRPPVSEPGLTELLRSGADRLRFSTEPDALSRARQAWITFDTPVDDDDVADVEWVLARSAELLIRLPEGSLVIVSSQLPVGSVSALQARANALRDDGDLRFACIPENLRLGSALDSFRSPDRIVAGVRDEDDRREVAELLAPFGGEIEWMGVESAEMTKHALNGFLATSVAFINEVASICEAVGADAAEVSRGLKSERRIGPRAYLAPGEAFAGGTLARDIWFLRGLAERHGLPAHLAAGVADANGAHKLWAQRTLSRLLGRDERPGGQLEGMRIGVWGLTYKPGTDTLRRSSAIELCRWLATEGAAVRAHDPAVAKLPDDLAPSISLCETPLAAAADADALVICTAWPLYRDLSAESLSDALAQPNVIDAAGFLARALGAHAGIRYFRVGSRASDVERLPVAEWTPL